MQSHSNLVLPFLLHNVLIFVANPSHFQGGLGQRWSIVGQMDRTMIAFGWTMVRSRNIFDLFCYSRKYHGPSDKDSNGFFAILICCCPRRMQLARQCSEDRTEGFVQAPLITSPISLDEPSHTPFNRWERWYFVACVMDSSLWRKCN
jgi:hypothetical protein